MAIRCLFSPFELLLSFLAITVSEAYSLQSGTWQFRGHRIAYEKAKVESISPLSRPDSTAEVPVARGKLSNNPSPVLLLNGFGVGSFHQHRLINEIYNPDDESGMQQFPVGQSIYCIDYLGQGKSWPEDCKDGEGPNETDLRYCGQTWIDQITSFIEEVILPNEESGKVHIVGNSVGGHLAVFLTAKRPDLVDTLVLLNATPVWGLNLPGWDGRLPAPFLPKAVGRYLFDQIRDFDTIEKYLETAYFNREAFDISLIQQIRECTDGNGGHAAFASILWSPPITVSDGTSELKFYDALSLVDCDVLLLFGENDPWCKPAFARRMLEMLPKHVAARYVQCTNVGHCPNHEAPTATAHVLQAWIQQSHEERKKNTPLVTNSCIQERFTNTETTLQELKSHEIDVSLIDRLAVTFV
mmetsp:Transcript_7185/g.9322  ORF Transcript_7185/g.9322 Transcript_7185/m.9322 type:complete len:412 (-) Transcript_7185:52-1287(-)|eukprot:CAMPEP_0198143550 /NCGR_PEP_ID=MMETSP1443-20131203/8531_1 /TAXON_ID=186043 /ORGANISM="Entomoneis sp., Strain CCMP2396" /LENGTH=411 /DNA_ID=CAMNT_0043806803 /DNA_START=94 /DNA_END=1329 /DNA_ORIENTATION=+